MRYYSVTQNVAPLVTPLYSDGVTPSTGHNTRVNGSINNNVFLRRVEATPTVRIFIFTFKCSYFLIVNEYSKFKIYFTSLTENWWSVCGSSLVDKYKMFISSKPFLFFFSITKPRTIQKITSWNRSGLFSFKIDHSVAFLQDSKM